MTALFNSSLMLDRLLMLDNVT